MQVMLGPAGGVEGVGVGVTEEVADGIGVPVTVAAGNCTGTAVLPALHALTLQAFTATVALVLAVNVVVSSVLPCAAGNGTPLSVQFVVVLVPSIVAVQVMVATLGALA